jgi:hypothetical protein
MGERVWIEEGQRPSDYHCNCDYCQQVIGELIRPQPWEIDEKTGKPIIYYSRNERRGYYDPRERGQGGHIAKTPLHIARWAVQQFTEPGEWVLDPTIGAGTTAVEALTQGRSVAGMEIQYAEVLRANVEKALHLDPHRSGRYSDQQPRVRLKIGDAREIGAFLAQACIPEFSLVVNNPPYSGDESMPSPSKNGRGIEHREEEVTFRYEENLPNLAFLKESIEYWDSIRSIYGQCIQRLKVGGHFVVGVKDQMRKKKPDRLHVGYCDVLAAFGLTFVGTAFLRHHPGTLFTNSYEKMHGVAPPKYQTISVFRRDK